VATSLLAFGVTIRPVEATNPASWKAGQAVVYKGSAALTQSAGGEENKVEFSASELAIARKSGDTTKLLVARAIFPKADGAMPEGAYNEFDVNGDEIFAHDAPMEVDGAQHILGVYIPLRVSVPRKEATKVAILGQAYVPVTAKLTTAQEEKGTRYTASLPEGKTQGFEFRASPGTLLAWKESYLVSKDGVILEKSFSYEFEVDIQGNKVKAGVSCDLKAEAPVATSDATLKRALGAFDAAHTVLSSRAASSVASPKVEAVVKVADEGPYAALARAANSHLQGLIATFEADEGGRVLAKIIGKKAPNFALDSLDGSKVDFHKVTNGKPTYLVFWGVG